VIKAALGVAALAAAAALGVVPSASPAGAATTPPLKGAVKVVFSGQGRQVLHDYKEWILMAENECYYDKTIDQASSFEWSAAFAAAPLRALAASAGLARGVIQASASGAVSGPEIRGDCGSDDVPPGWVQTITCSQPLQFGAPSLRIARSKAGKAVLELQAPPQSLQSPSPCALVPRTDLGAIVAVRLAALAKLTTGKSLTVALPARTSQVNCSSHPAPYEGTQIADDCRDTLTWSGTVTFVKA
jgi:hypothetical protein